MFWDWVAINHLSKLRIVKDGVLQPDKVSTMIIDTHTDDLKAFWDTGLLPDSSQVSNVNFLSILSKKLKHTHTQKVVIKRL